MPALLRRRLCWLLGHDPDFATYQQVGRILRWPGWDPGTYCCLHCQRRIRMKHGAGWVAAPSTAPEDR